MTVMACDGYIDMAYVTYYIDICNDVTRIPYVITVITYEMSVMTYA